MVVADVYLLCYIYVAISYSWATDSCDIPAHQIVRLCKHSENVAVIEWVVVQWL